MMGMRRARHRPGSDEGVSLDVYRELVAGLYRLRPVAVAISAITIALIGAAVATRIDDTAIMALTVAATLLTLGVIPLALAAGRAESLDLDRAKSAERRFGALMVASRACLGAMCAWGLIVSDDALAHLALVTLCLTCLTAAIRHHYRPWIAQAQIAALTLPPTVAMITKSDPLYWLLAVGNIVLAYTVLMVTNALYRSVSDNLVKDERLRSQNLRFDAALGNMAQGLCMLDPDGRVAVCNSRYLEIYDLSPAVVKQGTHVATVLAHSIEVGNHTGRTVEELVAFFNDHMREGEGALFHDDLADGRTVAVSCRVMEDGGWVTTHEDITARREAESRISYLARHDALTGLPNRVVLREALENALLLTARGAQVAVHCLDLDRFKVVNDTLGHPIGDKLLKAAAERLKECVRACR